MKSLAGVLLWTTLVCGVCSFSQRNHLNHVKPFLSPEVVQRHVQVPETYAYSYSPPEDCSGFSNFVHCFKLELLNNVSEILDSDKYWLTKNLVIEKLSPNEFDSFDDVKTHALRMRLKKYVLSGMASNKMILEGTMGIYRSHSLKWIVFPGINLRLLRNLKYGGKMDMALEIGENNLTAEKGPVAPRTFFRRKMQFALLSVMYKMGVITTLLGALVLITLKTLAVGMVLLFLTGFNTLKAIGAKLHALGHHGYHNNFHAYHGPEIIEASAPATQHKEVHVHIHNNGGGPHGYVSGGPTISESSSGPGPYHGWSSSGSSGSGFNPFRRSTVDTNSQQTSGTGSMKDDQVMSF